MSRPEQAAADNAAPNPNPQPAPARTTLGAKIFLAVTATALFGWLAVLGYTALTKGHSPVVSRSQAASADIAVVAELSGEGDTPATSAVVKEKLTAEGPEAGATVTVRNLPESKKFDPEGLRPSGYRGPGPYLLLLRKAGEQYEVARPGASPGGEGGGPPLIYRWDDDVRAQAAQLFPPAR